MDFLYIVSGEIVCFVVFVWLLRRDIADYERKIFAKPRKPKIIEFRRENYPFE